MWTYKASGGSTASLTTPGRSTTTGFIQQGDEFLQRDAAVADAVLVTGVELRCGLVQGSYEKQGVVAEAVRAARRACNLAVPEPFGDQRISIFGVLHQHHDTDVVCASAVGKICQQLVVVSPVSLVPVAFPPGVVGGMHAGRAAQRVDAQAGIVGERWQAGGAARVARLGERVLEEGVVRFVCLRNAELGLGKNLKLKRRQQFADLADLSRISRRKDQPLHRLQLGLHRWYSASQ